MRRHAVQSLLPRANVFPRGNPMGHSDYRSLLLAQRALDQASQDEEATRMIDQGLVELRQRFAE